MALNTLLNNGSFAVRAPSELTNKEGLTFREWLNAAGIDSISTRVKRAAWEAGEDPTEFYASRNG